MYIEIHLNSDELTEKDRAILIALGNAGSTAALSYVAEDTTPAVDGHTPKKRTLRKPKLTDAEREEKVEEALNRGVDEAIEKHADEPTPAPEPEEPKVDPKEMINDAAERAVKLIRAGKRDEVKGILDMLGLEKVTALKDSPEKVQDFLDAISKLED